MFSNINKQLYDEEILIRTIVLQITHSAHMSHYSTRIHHLNP